MTRAEFLDKTMPTFWVLVLYGVLFAPVFFLWGKW